MENSSFWQGTIALSVLVPATVSHLILISLGMPLSANDHLPHINRFQVISPKEEIHIEQMIPEHLGMGQITIFHLPVYKADVN